MDHTGVPLLDKYDTPIKYSPWEDTKVSVVPTLPRTTIVNRNSSLNIQWVKNLTNFVDHTGLTPPDKYMYVIPIRY